MYIVNLYCGLPPLWDPGYKKKIAWSQTCKQYFKIQQYVQIQYFKIQQGSRVWGTAYLCSYCACRPATAVGSRLQKKLHGTKHASNVTTI